MKKIIFSFFCLIVIIVISIFVFNKRDVNTNLTKIKVAEVAHSIFYAPQYVAINEGYFKEVNIPTSSIKSFN